MQQTDMTLFYTVRQHAGRRLSQIRNAGHQKAWRCCSSSAVSIGFGKTTAQGVLPAVLQISTVEQSLSEHLKDVRRNLKCLSITYVALIKDTHLLEVPEAGLLHTLLHSPHPSTSACAASTQAPRAEGISSGSSGEGLSLHRSSIQYLSRSTCCITWCEGSDFGHSRCVEVASRAGGMEGRAGRV